MFESARSASRASPISPGTSCEIDELSSPGNCARRSAMAWLLIAVGVLSGYLVLGQLQEPLGQSARKDWSVQ
uniref:Uncharacterized protein n=1 Tax=Fagus sylvatica TaxID=28930 RepID=A0A2N9GIA6_FAGSY